MILWDKKNDKEAKKMLVCNQTRWDVIRILKVYRCRWTGAECFHRDGKQHLGMGECQQWNAVVRPATCPDVPDAQRPDASTAAEPCA